MTHDPLCPESMFTFATCMPCHLIAAVRADEREKARQRVEALIEQARQSRDWRYDESYLNGLDDAAAAAGGDE